MQKRKKDFRKKDKNGFDLDENFEEDEEFRLDENDDEVNVARLKVRDQQDEVLLRSGDYEQEECSSCHIQ